ncbi:MAG TPA: sigma-70 family RNA polymerase sigma factor [Verrucomicrobiota bacterium]|nr:sigma-70 family RNA polymerase sigma factor [Verrucomicrobiota bacterium]HNT15877.1 sigma-70 family RNA polymerase sigma factor [Verrucomicrobiota bacterium]
MWTEECDLTELLTRVRAHDDHAARELVERLFPLVLRTVRRHLPRRTQEEDLAQEIFVKLFTRLDQYTARAGIPFTHWVSRLAVRTCLDALRAERRRPEWRWSDLAEDEAAWLDFMLTDAATPPDTTAAAARELVEKLLGQLPPDDRWVLLLLDLEQRSVKEIAQLTGWSRARVKIRAFRARRKLRKLATTLKNRDHDESL